MLLVRLGRARDICGNVQIGTLMLVTGQFNPIEFNLSVPSKTADIELTVKYDVQGTHQIHSITAGYERPDRPFIACARQREAKLDSRSLVLNFMCPLSGKRSMKELDERPGSTI